MDSQITLASDPRDIADPDAEVVVYRNGERYELRTSLGEGGMGEVRLCTDRVIGREVAMKVVLPKMDDRSEIRARFVREARVQGQLEHPAIVPVYDFGLDEEGRLFFTMKRIRGVTLEQVIDGLRRRRAEVTKKYTRHKLLAAFVRVCQAIDFAHEHGVLHRDLKPSNVMLGDYGEVYVLDWGLAKVRSASRSLDGTSASPPADEISRVDDSAKTLPADSGGTAAGAVLGTPGYMAPEQIRGEDVDARTDVYGLGGILFEILSLEPLHGAGNIAGMMKRALEGIDARPSARGAVDVPPELDALCVHACGKERSQRLATARELGDAVEAYLSGDRDLELRKQLAAVHLERAREAASRALVPGAPIDDRREALREIGRATALAPDDRAALGLLGKLLGDAPAETPREVVEIVEENRRASQRRILPRVGVLYTLAWAIFLPVQALLGIQSWALTTLPLVAWVAVSVVCLVSYHLDRRGDRWLRAAAPLSAVALGMSSFLFGPLLMLPAAIAMNTMGLLITTRKSWRRLTFITSLLAVVVPAALAWMRMHPVAHEVEDAHVLRITFAAFQVPRDALFSLLTVSHVMLIVIAAKFGAVYRDMLTAADTKNHLQVWQLKQLVGDDVPQGDAPARIG